MVLKPLGGEKKGNANAEEEIGARHETLLLGKYVVIIFCGRK